jgi:hypothetical protein
MIELFPQEAWQKYIQEAAKSARWMEDSEKISDELPISKRELFGLIILAHIRNHLSKSKDWIVGYDSNAFEPNDGLVSNGTERIDIEHKLVPQMTNQAALDAILSTYEKYSKKGVSYGSDRTLIIFANKATKGGVEISRLRDQIKNECPFKRVLLIHAVAMKENNTVAIIHVTEHYPGKGIAQVDLNLLNGKASVPYCELK